MLAERRAKSAKHNLQIMDAARLFCNAYPPIVERGHRCANILAQEKLL
jgi:hypothetical protein